MTMTRLPLMPRSSLAACLLCLLLCSNAFAQATEFSEGFEDVSLLNARGWVLQNNSSPLGPESWFQGTDTFAAHSGPENSYIAAGFASTAGLGTISNWLITPQLHLSNGTRIRFWTRTAPPFPGDAPFPDRLEVRLSLSGASIDVGNDAFSVGSFSTLLLVINPDLLNLYPLDWALFELVLDNIPEPASGRMAFRYFVTDSGPAGDNGNFIGIDTVSVTQPAADLIFRDRFEPNGNN